MKENEMKFNYQFEMCCGHTFSLQFNQRMFFDNDDEIMCLECKEYHLIDQFYSINDFNSFSLLLNKKW